MTEETPPKPVRPLVDVWLKPRRVFRALADAPVGRMDYLLATAQGMVSWLALCRAQSVGLHSSVTEIFALAVLAGPLGGILGIVLMTAIYGRIGRRAGGSATRAQVFHVLAYGGVPMIALLGIWAISAVVLGPAAFVQQAPANLDWFSSLVLNLRSVAHWTLIAWSLLIQIMGLSEIQGLVVRRAFGIWVVGQLLVLVAVIILAAVLYGPAGVPPG
jgi:hypothetical protein